ncbi:MAG: sigma-54-dependent Fis family transcriptional regulator [Desulfovibrionaceae bacterium]|jgi:DNA-binding NtrC family response regulator|nr:sigma-54-dependent Fis family transcriptional regulator [Desulfovibrionaceae bacterium]
MKTKLLIVDDEKDFLHVLKSYFSFGQYEVQTAISCERALHLLDQTPFDVVVTDMAMPEASGLDLLQEIKKVDRALPVIVMTGVGTIENAVESILQGAFHYIAKPFNPKDLENLVCRAAEHVALNRRLEREASRGISERFILGQSRSIQGVVQMASKVAASNAPILIMGETGTGKSMFARMLHEQSERREQPFLTIDCAALAETILESELFGHVKGAFTGAVSAKRGLLEEAQGGTIFLDEIGELSPGTQVKLLRAIQEQEIKPVGGNKSSTIDVRFISATSRDLRQEITDGRFRRDLYFRLAVIPLYLPPLRERREDLPLFVDHFIRRLNQEYRKNIAHIDREVMNRLLDAPWRGNIRELENVLERAVLLSNGETITLGDICMGGPPQPTEFAGAGAVSLKEVVEGAEKRAILDILTETGGNRSAAAKKLGIARRTLYDKLAQYGLD